MTKDAGNSEHKKENLPDNVKDCHTEIKKLNSQIDQLIEMAANPIAKMVEFVPDPLSPARLEYKKREFLKEFPKYGGITATARAIGIDPRTAWDWRQKDPLFLEAFQQLQLMVADDIQRNFIRRALDKSDLAAICILKAYMPEKYNDRVIHHHQIDAKIVNELVIKFSEASKKAMPEFCPHCNTSLGLTQKFVKELEALTSQAGLG